MSCNLNLIFVLRYFNLIIFILFANPVFCQQPGTRPVINIISPSAADSLNNSGIAQLRAEIVSSSALQSFRIINNDNVVLSGTGSKAERKDPVTYVIGSFVTLQNGINTIYVEAKNPQGTVISEKIRIRCLVEPAITWILPASPTSDQQSGKLTIKAEIKTLYDLQSIRTNFNGIELTEIIEVMQHPDADTYIFEKNIELTAGKNSIYISAGNSKGVTNSSTRTVYLGDVPVITFLSPAAGDSINETGIATVRSDIISNTPVLNYRIFHNGKIVSSESVAKPENKDGTTYIVGSFVRLQNGSNTIYIEATNEVGPAI